MTLLDRFRHHMSSLDLSRGRALLAVSGGPDSVALLDLLSRSRDLHGLGLVVAHLDHGIHPDSSRVAEQVQSIAASYQLPVELGLLSLGSAATETLARERRYAWLEELRARTGSEYVLTAHHADDQVETVLMRVLSGSGPAGLAGMAAVQGRLVRPLLPFHKVELAEYLSERGLQGWLDPANTDPRHLRSWIRTDLLPILRSRIVTAESNLQRLATHAASDRAAWDAVLDQLPGLDVRTDYGGISVAASALADYDSPLIQAAILALARRVGCPLGPSRAGRVRSLLYGTLSGSRVPLGGEWTAELAFGRLRIFRAEVEGQPEPLTVQGLQGRGTWGRWQFHWQRDIAPQRQDRAGYSAWFTLDQLTVRSWMAGEKLKPLGGTGRRLVVRCFQEERVPRSRRSLWPVLAQLEDIMWVPGVCRSDAKVPDVGSEALRVDAQYA